MSSWIDDLEQRTRRLAVTAIHLGQSLETKQVLPRSVLWQFVGAATSVGANHRAVRRARSARERIAKMRIVLEEVDETVFWLEIIGDVLGDVPNSVASLLREAAELRAIFATSVATLRKTMASEPGSKVPTGS